MLISMYCSSKYMSFYWVWQEIFESVRVHYNSDLPKLFTNSWIFQAIFHVIFRFKIWLICRLIFRIFRLFFDIKMVQHPIGNVAFYYYTISELHRDSSKGPFSRPEPPNKFEKIRSNKFIIKKSESCAGEPRRSTACSRPSPP